MTQTASDTSLRLVHAFPTILNAVRAESAARFPTHEFHKQFFAVAGNHVFTGPPRQNVGDIHTLETQVAESAVEYHHIVQEYTRKSGAVGYRDIDTKTRARALSKADSDYKGDLSRVCDFHRTTIDVNCPAQIKKIANLLRPCNNSSVVRFEDGFERLDEDGGMRRILCNIRLSNGHICEIQVRHIGMEKAYEKTESIYKKVRALKSRLDKLELIEDPDGLLNTTITKMRATYDHHNNKRKKIHETAAKIHKLDHLIVDRTYNFVNGFPVIETKSRDTGEYSAIIPDIQTGKFTIDNKFLSILEDKNYNVERSVPREIFMARSATIVNGESAKGFLQLVP